jgi:CBS domain-containing protein
MFAKDIMSLRLELINRKASMLEAAKKMAELNIGLLPVVDRNHIVGILTDRDLVVRGMARGVDPVDTEVDLIMTQEVVTCGEDETLIQVADKMERHALRRLLVVNAKNKPVGVISIEDLATRAPDKHLASSALYRGTGTSSVEIVD